MKTKYYKTAMWSTGKILYYKITFDKKNRILDRFLLNYGGRWILVTDLMPYCGLLDESYKEIPQEEFVLITGTL